MKWLDFFKSFEKMYRVLNFVFIFCCIWKYFVIIFDIIKVMVEMYIKWILFIEEVVLIVVLCFEGINFVYVDEVMF